jgi:hypothetical protein
MISKRQLPPPKTGDGGTRISFVKNTMYCTRKTNQFHALDESESIVPLRNSDIVYIWDSK